MTDYVPGPGDRVVLDSPYGYLTTNSPVMGVRIANGVAGVVVENAPGGGLRVLFDGWVASHIVPIHWLGLADKGGNG